MSFDPVSYAMGRAAAPGGTDVSDTTATAADVLSAKAFYLADGTKTTGSIASKAAQTYTPTTADQTIAAGQYLAGAQTVKGDANLVAGNIKKNVTIFGVTGSYEGGGGGGISLSSITITTPPTKTIYYDGDTFDASGMVITASYSNGMSRTVTGYTVSPTSMTEGTSAVTVSYTEAGVTKTATQAVTVYPAPTAGWATDSWADIQAVSLAGNTLATYGNQIGATRMITLTNGNTVTLRLANATNDLYDRSGVTGKTGMVVEFADMFSETRMNFASQASNAGGWKDSAARTNMAAIYDVLPSDLKAVIATVDVVGSNGGSDPSTINTTQDELFLPAAKELLGSASRAPDAENALLTQWQYYAYNSADSDRIKNMNGSARAYWTRSPLNGSTGYYIRIASDGTAMSDPSFSYWGAAPAFCI